MRGDESLAFDRTYLIGALVDGVLQSLTFVSRTFVLGIEALLLIIAGLYPVSLDDEVFDTEELFDELLADRQDIAELVEA